MPAVLTDFHQLLTEYAALLVAHGSAQHRCSEVIAELQVKNRAQETQIMQLRAAVVIRDSALAFAQADVTSLCVQASGPPAQVLEASLQAADLVICQTGCLSHGQYWRIQDHCKRTGKTCVLVAQPEALRIVRIHKNTPQTPARSLAAVAFAPAGTKSDTL